jgi:hypothetical protein
MRLLGAKIGAHAKMSTVFCFTPELLDAQDGSFFADGCYLGGRRTYGGRFELAAIRVGRRSFVGNSAILPRGADLGDDCLLGVLSMPPSHGRATPDGTDWLGSPAFRLPNRQKAGGFDERTTFRPTRKLYAQRAFVDACRVLIPSYTGFALGLGGLAAILYSQETYGLSLQLGDLRSMGRAGPRPVPGIGHGGARGRDRGHAQMGRDGHFQARDRAAVVSLCLAQRMVNAYESIMAPVVALCFGTPFAAPLLRLLGCRIGRHCYIGTSLFSEFDLVQIGDHVALNGGAIIQNHLFEDRIMKSSYLRIDDGCSVGNMAVVLYDVHGTRRRARAAVAADEGRDRAGWHSLARNSDRPGLTADQHCAVHAGLRSDEKHRAWGGRPVASAATLANPSFAKSSPSTNASITRTW